MSGSESRDSDAAPADSVQAAELLLSKGFLTRDPACAQSHFSRLSPPATHSLTRTPIASWPAIRTRHVLAFIASVTQSFAELKLLSIYRIFTRLRARRAARVPSAASDPDPQRLCELVFVFALLRPYLFRSRDACMLDSLALAHYLLYFGVPSRWVFGVQDAPFTSHCWLVNGTAVLNDSVEHVSGYVPLLEV